jgi:hypothetical protein
MTLERLSEILTSTIAEAHEGLKNPLNMFASAEANIKPRTEEFVVHCNADVVWGYIQKYPLAANIQLTRFAREHFELIHNAVTIHMWQRWLSASACKTAKPFHDAFNDYFGQNLDINALNLATSSIAFSNASALGEPTKIKQVEQALSLFEIWFAMQAPNFYAHDAWILRITMRPVVWLPVVSGHRMLSPNTLHDVLNTPLGLELINILKAVMPNAGLVDELYTLRTLPFVYAANQTVAVGKEGSVSILKLVTPEYGALPTRN